MGHIHDILILILSGYSLVFENTTYYSLAKAFPDSPVGLADCPAMSFVFVCQQIDIRNTNQLSLAIN